MKCPKTACSDAQNQMFQDARTPELSLESFPSKFPFIGLERLKTKGKQKLQAVQNLRISKSLKWPTYCTKDHSNMYIYIYCDVYVPVYAILDVFS